MQFLVIIEKGPASFGAYVPDLPGCVAVAETRDETLTLMREAIAFHLDCLGADGKPVPEQVSTAMTVDIES